MTNLQLSTGNQGVGIFGEIDYDRMGHSGGDPGVITFAFFDQQSSYGYILLFKNGFNRAMINTLIEVKRATAHLIVNMDS